MEYQYDVFFSYKRSDAAQSRNVATEWINNIFYWRFEFWLINKYLVLTKGKKPVIFRDTSVIKPGDPWPDKIKDALLSSRVLVAICSAEYFYSEWCQYEWEAFSAREKTLNTRGLRIPVRHNDCEEFLKDIEFCDCYEFTTIATEFYNSVKGSEFDKKIEILAQEVAHKAYNAPKFQAGWPLANIPKTTVPDIELKTLQL